VWSFVAAAITFAPSFAVAQEELESASSPSQVAEHPSGEDVPQNLPPSPQPAPVRRPKLAITAEQFDAFVALLGEPEDSVMRRLRHDPGLVPLAAAAADARRGRQRTGRNLMITGFTTAGLGATVALLGVLMATPGYPGESPRPGEKSTQSHLTTDFVGLVLVGLGSVTAIYGIGKVATLTDLETEAVNRYQGSPSASPLVFPSGSSRALSGGAGGKFQVFPCAPSPSDSIGRAAVLPSRHGPRSQEDVGRRRFDRCGWS
jgi:hypothetical protein